MEITLRFIPPSQIEYHIFLQQPILIEFCNSNNITVNAFAVLCTEDMLSSSHFLGKRLLPNIMEVAEVKELAEKYDKTEIQVLMRWIIEKNITILMRMNNSSRMHEIMGIFQFHLSKDDIQILNELDDNFRCVDLSAISGCVFVDFKDFNKLIYFILVLKIIRNIHFINCYSLKR